MKATPVLSIVCLTLIPALARADGDPTAAAKAFDAAQAAVLTGDHARAADLYQLADQIVPSPEALRGAVRERAEAGHIASAATLAARLLARYPSDERSTALGRETLRRFGPRLVLARVHCRPACALAADQRALPVTPREEHSVYLQPGAHVLEASFDDGRAARGTVRDDQAVGGATVEVDLVATTRSPPPKVTSASAPPPGRAEPAAPSASPGMSGSTMALIGGTILTVGLAAGATWSGLDTLEARDRFLASPSEDAFRAGERKQLRTNLLIGATLAAAAGTTLATLLLHRGSPERPAVALEVDPTSAVLALGGRF